MILIKIEVRTISILFLHNLLWCSCSWLYRPSSWKDWIELLAAQGKGITRALPHFPLLPFDHDELNRASTSHVPARIYFATTGPMQRNQVCIYSETRSQSNPFFLISWLSCVCWNSNECRQETDTHKESWEKGARQQEMKSGSQRQAVAVPGRHHSPCQDWYADNKIKWLWHLTKNKRILILSYSKT